MCFSAHCPERLIRHADDGRGVETAGEARTHRDIGTQAEADRVRKPVAELARRVLESAAELAWHEPIPSPDRRLIAKLVQRAVNELASPHLADAGEQGLASLIEEPPVEELVRSLAVQARFPARKARELLDLGRDRNQSVGRAPQVQRLDPEAIASRERPPGDAVDEHEGEHAVEALEASLAPFPVSVQDDLGVAARHERISQRFELRAKLDVIVDLAVVDDPVAPIGSRHRLMPEWAQVEDRQPSVRERDDRIRHLMGRPGRRIGDARTVHVGRRVRAAADLGIEIATAKDDQTLVVRAAVPHEVGHRARECFQRRRRGRKERRDPAHSALPLRGERRPIVADQPGRYRLRVMPALHVRPAPPADLRQLVAV